MADNSLENEALRAIAGGVCGVERVAEADVSAILSHTVGKMFIASEDLWKCKC